MRGRTLLCWVWAAIAVAAAVLAAACSGDADQQTQPEAAAPAAAANAPSSASATEEAAQQPAQSEPIQWSEGRCLSRLQDTSTYADSLQVDVADLQLDVRRGVTAEARWRWETSIQPTLDEMALAERELEEHCSEQLAPLPRCRHLLGAVRRSARPTWRPGEGGKARRCRPRNAHRSDSR